MRNKKSFVINTKTCTIQNELTAPEVFFRDMHRLKARAEAEAGELRAAYIDDFMVGVGCTIIGLAGATVLPDLLMHGNREIPMQIRLALIIMICIFAPIGGLINAHPTKEVAARMHKLKRVDYYVERDTGRYHTNQELSKALKDKETRKTAQLVVNVMAAPRRNRVTGEREAKGILIVQAASLFRACPCEIRYDKKAKSKTLTFRNDETVVTVPVRARQKRLADKAEETA